MTDFLVAFEIAFAIGAIIKLIFNLLLIPIEIIGVKGAIIASILSHITSFVICFVSLKKNLNIKFEINKFFIKPVIASIIMFFTSYVFYTNLYGIISPKILLIMSLLFGTFIYIVSIIILKILSEEEIYMIPYGQKTYKKLQKIKKQYN